jgi:predicted nucleic acid-binding protein
MIDCLADTNVLVRTVDRLHPHHPIALNALDIVIRRGGHIYIAAQNLIEFWSVCTRPLSRNGLGLSTSEAEKEMSHLESAFLLLPETPAIFPEWRRLVTAHGVSGFDVFDARLVAIMSVYGLRDLLTFNGADFRRYTAINVVDPATIN